MSTSSSLVAKVAVSILFVAAFVATSTRRSSNNGIVSTLRGDGRKLQRPGFFLTSGSGSFPGESFAGGASASGGGAGGGSPTGPGGFSPLSGLVVGGISPIASMPGAPAEADPLGGLVPLGGLGFLGVGAPPGVGVPLGGLEFGGPPPPGGGVPLGGSVSPDGSTASAPVAMGTTFNSNSVSPAGIPLNGNVNLPSSGLTSSGGNSMATSGFAGSPNSAAGVSMVLGKPGVSNGASSSDTMVGNDTPTGAGKGSSKSIGGSFTLNKGT